MSDGWVGVDFDGTLAVYEWTAGHDLGAPVPAMLERVKRWRAAGIDVRIVTARASEGDPDEIARIKAWLVEHVGEDLPVTATKDYHMIELWDDRAVNVEKNTGAVLPGTRSRIEARFVARTVGTTTLLEWEWAYWNSRYLAEVGISLEELATRIHNVKLGEFETHEAVIARLKEVLG